MGRVTGYSQTGFTLLELALVLFIVTLVLGATLTPLGTLLEGRKRTAAMADLEAVRESLIGFAMLHGYLPCPAMSISPASDDYGEQADACQESRDDEGYLPWRTLGLTTPTDPFNRHWRYRVDRRFSNSDKLFTLATRQQEAIAIVDDDDNLLVSRKEAPIAVIYSTGANVKADGNNASYEGEPCGSPDGYESETGKTTCPHGNPKYQAGGALGVGADAEFDDIVIWLSRPLLFNRMVTVGRLP